MIKVKLITGETDEVDYGSTIVSSRFISDILQHYGSGQTFELHTDHHLGFALYQQYVTAGAAVVTKVVSQPQVSDFQSAFKLSLFLDDDEYFSYLIQLLLDDWVRLQVVVLNETDKCLQREMCLQIPYLEVPESLRYQPAFVRDWLQVNAECKLRLTTTIAITSDNTTTTSVFRHLAVWDKTQERLKQLFIFEGDEESQNFLLACLSYHSNTAAYQISEQRNFRRLGQDGSYSCLVTTWYPLAAGQATAAVTSSPQMKRRVPISLSREDNHVITSWYPSGQVEMEFTSNASGKHGHYRSYFANGRLKEQGQYLNNQRYGTWTEYNNNYNNDYEDDYEDDSGYWTGDYTAPGVRSGVWQHRLADGEVLAIAIHPLWPF